MKKSGTETNNPQENQATNQPIAIQIACLSIFPVLYLVGKTAVAFIG